LFQTLICVDKIPVGIGEIRSVRLEGNCILDSREGDWGEAMGRMRHHAIVVTGPSGGLRLDIRHVRARAAAICGENMPGLVSPVVLSVVNGYGTFIVAPDGSKESRAESDHGDEMRAKVIEYLESLRYPGGDTSFDYVEVLYGDDRGEAKLLRYNDTRSREQQGACRSNEIDAPLAHEFAMQR